MRREVSPALAGNNYRTLRMSKPTERQKQFLNELGRKSLAGLTKESASTLIDDLLAKEKSSGKTFPCPYCGKPFGPRPKRTKKCPSCGQTIVHLSGRFYTETRVDELDQAEWLNDAREDNRANVKSDWKDELKFRKEFREILTVGYLLKIGPACTASRHLNGLLVLIEDAFDAPEFLPPYPECNQETCECTYEPVSQHEVPKGTKFAEFEDPKQQAKLKTRASSPFGAKPVKTSGLWRAFQWFWR